MNKKILISLSIISVFSAIVIGGTVAYFSDTETSSGNTFTAGTLNLKVGYKDPTIWKFEIEDIKPGEQAWQIIPLDQAPNIRSDFAHVEVKNIGSTDGYLHITFSNLVNAEMGCTESEKNDPIQPDNSCENPGPNQGELAENLEIWAYLLNQEEKTITIYRGKAKGILQGDLFNYPLPSGDSVFFRLEWALPNSVGNVVQTDKVGFDVVFELTQNKKEDIVGDWHFNENIGSVTYDNSGYGNDGVVNGATWVEGRYNPALSFDGIDDYINVANNASLNITGDISIEAWIYPTRMDLYDTILVKGTSSSNYAYFLAIGTAYNNSLSFQLGGVGEIQTGTVPINLNQWNHVVGVREGNTIKTYVNGVLSYQKTVSAGNIRTNTLPLEIGRYDEAGYFNGLIDEVRVYKRALSPTEILERYNIGR